MVLGKLPVPGHPTVWMIVGQGSSALAVGTGGVVWTFFVRRPDIDLNTVSKGR